MRYHTGFCRNDIPRKRVRVARAGVFFQAGFFEYGQEYDRIILVIGEERSGCVPRG